MSGPYLTLQKFMVLKMIENQQLGAGKALQQEIIDNALATAKAIQDIERIGKMSFFNIGQPPQQQQPQQQQQQPQQQQPLKGFANPQQPAINLPQFNHYPADMSVDDLMAKPTQQEQQQQQYNAMTQHHAQLSAYNQGVMEINRMLMAMQQEFFGNVQKIQLQLSEITKTMFTR